MEKTTSTTMDVLASAFVRPQLEVATPFYLHPYGGKARNIYVSREAFMRFWNIDEQQLEMIQPNIKWFDDMQAGAEVLGYVIQEHARFSNRKKPLQYVIVVIQYRRTIVDVEMN